MRTRASKQASVKRVLGKSRADVGRRRRSRRSLWRTTCTLILDREEGPNGRSHHQHGASPVYRLQVGHAHRWIKSSATKCCHVLREEDFLRLLLRHRELSKLPDSSD